MQDITKFPHFIPDKPTGEDCFEGHSQEKLAHSVCDYMRQLDAKNDSEAKNEEKFYCKMPRIIGIEGEWGSGKSNVVNMIGQELDGEGYYTFTYDAWGHQEDLQRRSILEVLTRELISEKVLTGNVEIQMRNGKQHDAEWEDQLSLLLSNKTTTIRKSTPKLTIAVFWGIGIVALFAICSLVAGQLVDNANDFKCFWWIDVIPILVAFAVAICYRIKDGSWDNIFRMVDHTNNDTIDEEYTSSEEPSVAEFKNWMRAVSNHLGNSKRKYKRLIIVFDNMDRLPSDKVMQLWSSIYTFFAGGEFEHIWTIIPYDYEHLCQAIYGNEEDDRQVENAERIKLFISKTFPITYHIPEPVITDYRKLFITFFDKAFGPDVHDKEHICQVYMHLEDDPNPRTVIRFVNELVALRLQWSDAKYRLQNQALYILKKDYLFYSGKRLETQLLSEELFEKVAPFYPDQDQVRKELCQYAYGLEDEKLARETPLRNELKRRVEGGESVAEYVSQDNFLSIFEKVITATNQSSLNYAVKSMASLDDIELQPEIATRIHSKWDFLANMKASSKYESHKYDDALTTLINHATHKRVNQLARSFAAAMQRIKVTDGVSYFQAQNRLQLALQDAKIEYNDSGWYKTIICEPEQFVQYVCEAKEQYAHYGLTSDTKALNKFLLNGAISGNSLVTSVVDYIKEDGNYDLTDLRKGLSKAISEDSIKQDIHVTAYVHRVLSKDEDVLKVRFKPETVSAYLSGDQSPWAENLPVGLEDVIAMSLADGKDINEIDDIMLPRIAGCLGKYMNYTSLLEHTGKEGTAYRKLNIYYFEHLKGGKLNTIYAARHLAELQQALGVDIAMMLKQFNEWPVVKWGEIDCENEYVKDVRNYMHLGLMAAYKNNPGNFSDSIIKLGVGALRLQNVGFLAKVQQVQQAYNRMVPQLVIDNYWKTVVITYLGTSFMKESEAQLTNEAVTMLQWLYDHNEVKESALLDVILQYSDEPTLKSYLHNMMNDHFDKTDINKEKFKYFGMLLPMLGSDMNANTARGLMQHFIKPICKDAECASIIVAHKEFYLAIMHLDTAIASSIVKDILEMDEYVVMKDSLKNIVEKEEKKKEKGNKDN